METKTKTLYFWKRMANIWFVVTAFLFFVDFFSAGSLAAGVSMVNIIYPAVVTIYTGHKELARWRDKGFKSRYSGESIVIVWTLMFVLFGVISVLSRGRFTVSLEMATTYIAILSIYAVTMKSKELRAR